MDIGFNFDLSDIKIFEYNTGLCGELYDTAIMQKNMFDYYFKRNFFKYYLENLKILENSDYSGSQLLKLLGERWKFLLSSNNLHLITPVYFITANGNEEHLVVNCLQKALEINNLGYKTCKYAKSLSYNNGILKDLEYNYPVEFLYKTYSWYKILKEFQKSDKKFFNIFQNDNKKFIIIEPIWKTVMGSKALLPFVYKFYPKCKYLIPTSFNPFDKIFEGDEYIIRKSIYGRGSKSTKILKIKDIDKNKLEKGFIYQKIFKNNKYKGNYFIMGAYTIGPNFGGLFVKKSNKIINDYHCNIIPVRFLKN